MIRITVIGNSQVSLGMDGCTRIFIECAKPWIKKGVIIDIFTNKVGHKIYQSNGLTNNVNYTIWPSPDVNKCGLSITYFVRTIIGCWRVRKVSLTEGNTIIYSGSDFWPDSLPALTLKLRYRNRAKWIAGFYLSAPKPWQKDSPYRRKRFLIGLFYWLTQLPIYWIVKRYADMIFVTSEPDVEKFVTKKRERDKVIAIRGGVDIRPSEEHLNSGDVIPVEKRKYDACFVGRFHPQKGVFELINIWKLVCKKKPDAKLAMIGIGPLETDVKIKIAELSLNNDVDLLGFKDGEEKYEIFKESKIVVHPATYDSGGMAACEAMAWGLPGVSFDLEALKTYYPKGMLKTPCYNLKAFAENIIKLLKDRKLYKRTQEDAITWAKEWDWDRRANKTLDAIHFLFNE